MLINKITKWKKENLCKLHKICIKPSPLNKCQERLYEATGDIILGSIVWHKLKVEPPSKLTQRKRCFFFSYKKSL